MKTKILSICGSAVLLILFSCNDKGKDCPETPALRERIITAKEQAALTPEAVIKSLKEGNALFVANNVTARDHSAMVRNAVQGQFPKAVILSCLDSRIPVEDVFNKGIGDLFVGRVAGNFANTDLLGSMEFGCKLMGAKVVIVLGHESCGAITSAINNNVTLGNLPAMLENIRPAVTNSQDFSGDKTSANKEFVAYVSKNNVLNTIKVIREKSPTLKEMEDKGQIKIVGAYYNMSSGKVDFL
ncbi:carbonic anhydrase family protein [Flavobacterium sp. UBA7680]|uniref:carbonic anhydrase family protein n=1 Tax=Flavobacterium sp. UBA7680 TaxID=1946559 RepID=UPI0025C0DD31|nr:carbonic anhydrase family protein [Flavobacterium sp. UBA7680]